MTDERGTFEHALFREPRQEHGYCTDDWRVCSLSPRGNQAVRRQSAIGRAQPTVSSRSVGSQGKCRNRMNQHGSWDDPPALNDCWGRCIWGSVQRPRSDDVEIRHRATRGLEHACDRGHPGRRPSRSLRSVQPNCSASSPATGRRAPCWKTPPIHDETPLACQVAMARAAPYLRQCHPSGGNDCGRVGTRTSGPREARPGPLGMAAPSEPDKGTSRSPQSGVVVPMTLAPDSINSPLRWQRWSMRVRVPDG